MKALGGVHSYSVLSFCVLTFFAVSGLAFATPLNHDLALTKHGGGLGQNVSFTLRGNPGTPYLLLFDGVENEFDIGGGETLYVGFRFVSLALNLPGFVGVLNGAGEANITLPLPNDIRIDPVTITFQAIKTNGLDRVSNHVRLTPSFPEVFESTLDQPLAAIATDGIAARQPGGNIAIIPTLIPLVENYDENLEEFDESIILCSVPFLSAKTALPDGRVVVSGGLGLNGQPTDQCLLIDPSAGTCTAFQMSTPRAGHASALTRDGNVLITGGFSTFDLTDLLALFGGIRNTTELFDPIAGIMGAGPTLLEPKAFHTATMNGDGDILVAGGLTLIPIISIPFVSNTSYLYQTSSNSFFFLPTFFGTGRLAHSAALLDDGRIILVGGVTIDFEDFINSGDLADLALTALDTAEVWRDSLFGGSYTTIGGMGDPRVLPAVIALDGGEALIAGGFEVTLTGDLTDISFEALASADLFLTSTTLRPTRPMAEPRLTPFGIRLEDGTALIIGGGVGNPEIYQR